jgi:hypothetical protein
VIINDMRTTASPAPEVSEQTGPNGERQFHILLRDSIYGMASQGGMDKTMALFGQKRLAT